MTANSQVLVSANSIEPDVPKLIDTGNLLYTPTGGTQTTLKAATSPTGSRTVASLVVTGNMSVDATKFGAFGATAVTQPTASAQASIVDGSIGTANPTTGVDSLVGTQLITLPISMKDLANAQVFQVDPGFAGKLLSVNFRDTVAVTTSAKAATVQAQVNGTNLTGGVISLSGTYAVGAAQAGTAITSGTQTFTSAQTVGASISSVTTFSEGAGVLEFSIINTDTANAISTVIAQGNAIRAALVLEGMIKGS